MISGKNSKGKFQEKWEPSFVIDKIYSNRACGLLNHDGDICRAPINRKFLKRYYA